MNANLTLAKNTLLSPGGLDESALERLFGSLLGPGIDAGDLYFQSSRHESWALEDGLVKDGSHSIESGVGVRALSGERAALAYSDALDLPALTEA
ncbi:MAG: metalloprotease TldD, partial [Xanthomonadales bacterium]|nr:metalloprotease TldD [Xanthomonadales bacterium]